MRNTLLKPVLFLCLIMFATLSWSLVTDYTFSSNLGTYSEISDGTTHGSNLNNEEVFNAVPIGFDFTFNEIVYNNVSISSNGFIAMGPTVVSAINAINAGASNNVIVPLNRDLISRSDGSLMSLLSGDAPNRVFTIQWKNYRRTPAQCAVDSLNFQIQLFETSNVIKFAYGHFRAASFSIAGQVQVGLRGAANTEFSNRTTTTNWQATTVGLVNSASCTMNNTIVPTNGLVFNWLPAGGPPSHAQIVSPANNATDVGIGSSLHWVEGGGAPTGYKIYFGTDNPPSNIENGTEVTAITYDPNPDMLYNTAYFWKIVPFNVYGDAVDCPIWTFTTLIDPTVTNYPYTQNWDSVTAPFVPSSWTVVNANADASTWITVNSGANSAPNAIRCAYNTAVAMDDWFISPPLQLTADSNYRIRFQYKAQANTYVEKLEVKFGTSNTVNAMTTQIFNNANITNAAYQLGEAYITPTTSGIYYVGFHGYSAANMYYLYVDDINIGLFVPTFNPPQNLTATTGNGTVNLSWQAPVVDTRVLAGYKVFRNGTLITPTQIIATTYRDAQAEVGVPCNYVVTAIYTSPNGSSVPSNTVNITPIFNPPANLQAVPSPTVITLNWQVPSNSTPVGYKVFRNAVEMTPNAITALTYVDNTCISGHPYTYYATAIYANPDGSSLPSNEVISQLTEALTPPTGLTAQVSGSNVILNWVAPASRSLIGVQGNNRNDRSLDAYKIYRNGSLIHTENNPTILTYTDTNLLANTYNYTISALYTTGESAQTAPVPAIVQIAFNPPLNVVASDGVNISVTWNPPNPIQGTLAGYRVVRDGIVLGHGLLQGTSYIDAAVTTGTTYTYYVKAFYTNPAGESAPSNSDQATCTPGATLNPVTNLGNTVVDDNVFLTWTPPGGPILQDWISYNVPGVIVNGIGTNGVANFDAAIRFTQTELTGLHNRYLTKMRFYPREVNCIYTAKIWIGGTSATNPGTLTVELPIANPVIGTWNEVTLPTPIPIPSTGEMWIGYNVNAQAGYPAGCDAGPSIPYKSNLIYTDGAWTILTLLNQDLTYNWDIQGFVVNFIGRETMISQANLIAQPDTDYSHNGAFSSIRANDMQESASSRDLSRNLIGYKVYRDGINIASINDYTISHYTDRELPNGSYIYTVTAWYSDGESVPSNASPATINVPFVPIAYQDGFETYDNFTTSINHWLMNDVDDSETATFSGTTFPGAGEPMAFMVFNPSATTPPLTGVTANNGSKMLACFSDLTAPNNDYILSPRIRLGAQNQISLWVKSFTADYGLERYRVGIAPNGTTNPSSFVWFTGASYEEAPVEWTKKIYYVPNTFNATTVRFVIKCESDSAFIFLVDDVTIRGFSATGNDDNVTPLNETTLQGNYPNPFKTDTIISYSVKDDSPVKIEIFNQKGQKVKTLINGKEKSGNHTIKWSGDDENGKAVSNGIYMYRMSSGKYSDSKKMILIK